MQPQIAVCNIFNQNAELLAAFAERHGFEAIEWTIAPQQPRDQFVKLMRRLEPFDVRYHCRHIGVDLAFSDDRGESSLELLNGTVEQVAEAGGKYLTVHIGLGNPTGAGLDIDKAIANLSRLVLHGERHGVAVALENVTTPPTNDPDTFNRIVAESGAYVTIDIGHAHAVRELKHGEMIYERYILPNSERMLNAHVYHTELGGIGHVPPDCLWDLFIRLKTLSQFPRCDWWVIQLQDPKEVLQTRIYLKNFLESEGVQRPCSRSGSRLDFNSAAEVMASTVL